MNLRNKIKLLSTELFQNHNNKKSMGGGTLVYEELGFYLSAQAYSEENGLQSTSHLIIELIQPQIVLTTECLDSGYFKALSLAEIKSIFASAEKGT